MPRDARRDMPAGGHARWSMLSGRQKRELLQLMGVGLLSVLIVAGSTVLSRRYVPSGSSPSAARPEAGQAVAGLAARPVQVRQIEVQVASSAPALAPTGSVVRGGVQPGAQRAAARNSQRPPLARRLARLFAGDGRHTVQPFPMVPATHR